eukprot:235353-Chlamydomonas_euryale.AAC.1
MAERRSVEEGFLGGKKEECGTGSWTVRCGPYGVEGRGPGGRRGLPSPIDPLPLHTCTRTPSACGAAFPLSRTRAPHVRTSHTAGRAIDYIVVSHTEPDHSGLIPAVLDRYPEAIVCGSK